MIDEITNENLHSNHLLILDFLYPNEYKKGHVVNDKDNVGHYHEDILMLWDVISKIEVCSTQTVPVDIAMSNGLSKISVYRNYKFNNLRFQHIEKYSDPDNKVLSIYLCCVAFIKWHNTLKIKLNANIKNYYSPHNVIGDVVHKEKRVVFNDLADIESLKEYCASLIGISIAQLNSLSRIPEYVIARQLAMSLLYMDGYTTTEIGRFFGKDHSTVVYAKQRILNLIEIKDFMYYPKIKDTIEHFGLENEYLKDIKL